MAKTVKEKKKELRKRQAEKHKKTLWKPATMIYPVPAVMVSCGDYDGLSNIITVAWTGIVSSEPPTVYISVRPERYSYDIIKASGEFVINLTTEALVKKTDFCGVCSGRDVDKWEAMDLTKGRAARVKAPLIEESPVNIECAVESIVKAGSHDMFIAKVLGVDVEERFIDERGRLDLGKCKLTAYAHGEYFALGKLLGSFGYSVKK